MCHNAESPTAWPRRWGFFRQAVSAVLLLMGFVLPLVVSGCAGSSTKECLDPSGTAFSAQEDSLGIEEFLALEPAQDVHTPELLAASRIEADHIAQRRLIIEPAVVERGRPPRAGIQPPLGPGPAAFHLPLCLPAHAQGGDDRVVANVPCGVDPAVFHRNAGEPMPKRAPKQVSYLLHTPTSLSEHRSHV